MTRTSIAPTFQNVQPAIQVLGVCTNEEAEQVLIASGVPAERIWMRDRGHETLEEAIYFCRGLPAVFRVAEDLRIFGERQVRIFGVVTALNRDGITLQDVTHPDHSQTDMIERALKALHSAASIKSRKIAKRRGSRGGLTKAANEAARRNARIEDAIARRLCASRLTWDEKSEILGMPKSTIERHYRVQQS